MIRWAILGAGNIAHRFAASLQAEENSILYAVSGRSKEKLERFREEYPCEKIYTSYEEMLDDADIDAVYLALPPAMHMHWACRALERKIPVLCEKPAVPDHAQLEEVLRCAQKNETLFMEAMKSRFTPAYRRLKKIVSAGWVGELRSLSASACFELPPEQYAISYLTSPDGGGALLDSGIYCASFITDFVPGTPVILDVRRKTGDGVDLYDFAEIQYGEIRCTLETAMDRNLPKTAVLTGSEGSVTVFDCHRPQRFLVEKGGEQEEIFLPYDVDDFYGEIHHFCELVISRKTESPVMTYGAMRREFELLDMIRQACH